MSKQYRIINIFDMVLFNYTFHISLTAIIQLLSRKGLSPNIKTYKLNTSQIISKPPTPTPDMSYSRIFYRDTSCIFTEVWFHTYWFPIEYLGEQFYLSDWMDRSKTFNEVSRIKNGTIIFVDLFSLRGWNLQEICGLVVRMMSKYESCLLLNAWLSTN